MKYEYERIKNLPQNIQMKFKLSHKTINANSNKSERETMHNLVSSFRQGVFHPKITNNKFKTSKNSRKSQK